METTKKITLATVKSFVKKNRENLFINVRSSFDGMVDGLAYYQDGFTQATKEDGNLEHTLGICGAWFVGQSRDYFQSFTDGNFEGIKVHNACGSFIIALKVSSVS